jgi:hypothetical protein
MNLAPLTSLGKVAGIGGIALGVVVLLGDKLVGSVTKLPAADRAAAVQLLTLCCFGIGALGLLVWLAAIRSDGASASTQGDGAPAINAGGNVAVNSPGMAALTIAAKKAAVTAVPLGRAKAKGKNSGAVNAGGSVTVNTDPPPKP